MALIDCPSCSKKISDKAKQCSHCETDFTKTSTDDVERKQGLSKFKRSQRIQNQSMLAMILFIGGLAYMFTGESVDPESIEYLAAITVTVIGFAWYIVNRVRMIWLKRFS